ncbi:carbohydrate ABC transporter permease [Bacillus sp. T33-2]|uniref:carbohydrate ABC transporter permease n=1 Tax=Bacillus sp. T33-2 TaxID=2054168 RepID=UPI000C78D12A|nr:carbohydrate ABC transporter permease [Bacillus sp. T33-2]PLR94674.1 ABC transporter permease [Bacillus sp. T33-2]
MTHTIRINRLLIYLILILMSIFYLIPLYVIVMTSLKTASEATLDNIWNLPSSIDFSAYKEAFSILGPHYINTFLLVIPATLISSILGSLNGYVLSKWKFKGSEILFTLLLFGMFIPYQSILIPMVTSLQKLGLYNTIPGLILVHAFYGVPITTLIFRNFYAGIPTSMVEAAKSDGCGILGSYYWIILPLSIPAFVVTGIWQFTSIWNDFLLAVTVTGKETQPIMVALQSLAGSQVTYWNLQMAGSILAALPTMIVYIFLSKYFIRGMLAGSVKG